MFDGFSFNPLALLDDGLRPAEVGVGGCDVVEALVIALMVEMFDERFDLALRPGMELCAANMARVFCQR